MRILGPMIHQRLLRPTARPLRVIHYSLEMVLQPEAVRLDF